MVGRVRAAIVVVVVLGWALSAAAQRASDEAEREYRLGYKALQAGDCAEALVHYRRSLELTPRPRTLFNIAACEEELGLQVDAWRSYHAFLDLAEERDAEIVVKAVARIAALRAMLRGQVTVESSPPGASVIVDGERQARGVTPIVLELAPGSHRIRVTMPDAVPAERTVEVRPAEGELLSVTLAPATDGTLADTVVDVVPTRMPPALPPATVVVAGGSGPIHLMPGEVIRVDLEAPRASSRRPLAWGLGGLGVAAIAGGAAVGVLALRDVTSPMSDEHDRGKRRALIADGLIVAGTVAVIVAWRWLRARAPSVAITRASSGER